MLSFNGKRLGRIRLPRQLNMDPELIELIARRAERHLRPIGMEIIHLLMTGLCADPEEDVTEHFRIHALMSAPPRTVPHTQSRKEKIAC